MSISSRAVAPVDGGERPTRVRVALVLSFAFLGTLFDGAELNLVGYPLAYVADSLHVSTIALVQVTTLQGFASIAGGLACGWLGDRYGRRWTYTGSVLIFGVAAVLGGLAPSYGLFLLTRLVAGVGMGGLFGLAFAMFAECWSTRRRGAMGGAIQAMYFGGQMVTVGVVYFCTTRLGAAEGWRGGYVVLGVATLVIGVLAAILLPESPRWRQYHAELAAGQVPERLRPAKVPFADLFRGEYARGTLLFAVLATGMFFTTNSLISYLTTFLVRVEKVPLGTASLIVLVTSVVTAITYPTAGAISDSLGRRVAVFWSSLIGVVGFGWLMALVVTGSAHVSTQFWADQTFWAIVACAAGAGGFGVLGVWMAEYFPTRLRSAGSNTSYYAGRGFGAGLFPLLALGIGGSVPLALALGLLGPVLCAMFAFTVPDRTGRTIEAVE